MLKLRPYNSNDAKYKVKRLENDYIFRQWSAYD